MLEKTERPSSNSDFWRVYSKSDLPAGNGHLKDLLLSNRKECQTYTHNAQHY